jgi:hypothetical protein
MENTFARIAGYLDKEGAGPVKLLAMKTESGIQVWTPEGPGEATPVMLIGAGSAGQMILRDITRSKELNERVVCIIDDNPNKWNRDVDGVPVVGGRDEIMAAAVKYGVKKIYLAIPSASMQNKRDILNICNETGCELKQLPGMYQLASGQLSVSSQTCGKSSASGNCTSSVTRTAHSGPMRSAEKWRVTAGTDATSGHVTAISKHQTCFINRILLFLLAGYGWVVPLNIETAPRIASPHRHNLNF